MLRDLHTHRGIAYHREAARPPATLADAPGWVMAEQVIRKAERDEERDHEITLAVLSRREEGDA